MTPECPLTRGRLGFSALRLLNDFGLSRYRGGSMYWADVIGVSKVYRRIQAWHQQYGERRTLALCCVNWPKAAPRCAKPNLAARCNGG